LFAQASKIPFLFARSSPPNDPLQQSARKNEPDRNFFFGHNLLDWTDRTLPRNPMPFVNSTLPGSISHHHAPQVISHLCIPTSLPRSQSQFLKKISFGLLSFTTLVQLVRGPFALLAPPSPTYHPPNGKVLFLGCFSLFQSSFSIHYHYSILRSSFFVLLFSRNLKNGPLSLLPPMSVRVACGWRFGLGSDSLDRSTAQFIFSSTIVTGNSVYY